MQRLKEEVNNFDWTSAGEKQPGEDDSATTGDQNEPTRGER